MSLETTYQNDFKPYNIRYGFLNYPSSKQQNKSQMEQYNWLSQCENNVPWRRHVAAVNENGQNSVEWISIPGTQYTEPEFYKNEPSEFDRMMKKGYESEMIEPENLARNEFYHRVRFAPWQFIYPEDAKLQQTQGDFFERTSPLNVQSVNY